MWLTILLLLASSPNASEINTARYLYFSATDEESTLTFLNHCQTSDSKNALFQAYRGCALAMSAEYSYNPITKLSRFNDGKDLIEQAVTKNPSEPEIRFLRLGVQTFAPGFLNYNNDVNADVAVIMTALKNGYWNGSPDFKSKVVAFLLKHAPLSSNDKLFLRSDF